MGSIRNIYLVLIIIISMLIGGANEARAEKGVDLVYFGVKSCFDCVQTERLLDSLSSNYHFNYIYIDISEEDNREKLLEYNISHNMDTKDYQRIPAVFIDGNAIVGFEEIEKELPVILSEINSDEINKGVAKIGDNSIGVIDSIEKNMGVFAVFLGGFLDGFNPCAISMMLFFFSLVQIGGANKKKVFKIGLFFILGTFSSYFLMGLGLYKFVGFLNVNSIYLKIFNFSIALLALYLVYLNIHDYFKIKKGEYGQIKNQLSKEQKSRIHSFIKKKTGGTVTGITAFSAAFVISILEFFCTGQMYIPVISYLVSSGKGSYYSVVLLVIYNLAFVIPLIVITSLFVAKDRIFEFSSLFTDKLHIIKLMGAIFFVFVFAYSISRVLAI